MDTRNNCSEEKAANGLSNTILDLVYLGVVGYAVDQIACIREL